MKGLNKYFLSEVKMPRSRMGKKQDFETLIKEEVYAVFEVSKRRIEGVEFENC